MLTDEEATDIAEAIVAHLPDKDDRESNESLIWAGEDEAACMFALLSLAESRTPTPAFLVRQAFDVAMLRWAKSAEKRKELEAVMAQIPAISSRLQNRNPAGTTRSCRILPLLGNQIPRYGSGDDSALSGQNVACRGYSPTKAMAV